MSKLYELSAELLELQNMLEDDVDLEVLADTLEGLQGEYEYKLEGYAKVIKNLEAEMTAYKTEADRMYKRSKTLQNNIDILKRRMFDSMKLTGVTKVKGQLFTLAIQKNGGKAPIIYSTLDVDAIPAEYFNKRIEYINGTKVREELEAGKELDWAYIGERGESLRIR